MVKRCAFCRLRPKAGIATFYAATTYPTGLRLSHRLYLCALHYEEALQPYISRSVTDDDDQQLDRCAFCDTDVSEDHYFYYVTAYPPRSSRVDLEALLCFEHHTALVELVSTRGLRLEDRPRARAEEPELDASWAALAS